MKTKKRTALHEIHLFIIWNTVVYRMVARWEKWYPTLPSGDTIFINTCVISFLNQSAFSIFARFSMVRARAVLCVGCCFWPKRKIKAVTYSCKRKTKHRNALQIRGCYSDTELTQFLEKQENPNTKRKTAYIDLFRCFIQTVNPCRFPRYPATSIHS